MNQKKLTGQLRHDALVYLVLDELLERGYNTQDIVMFKEYGNHGVCGEIDLYAIKDDYILLFEAKCTDSTKNRKKAINQMNRAQHYFFEDHLHPCQRVFKFMVNYDKNDKGYRVHRV